MKQVIIFRKDLKCRKGKFAAQVAHASSGTGEIVSVDMIEDYDERHFD